jgi:hypothetical protein
MTDESEETIDRRHPPHVGIEVEPRLDPYPGVDLIVNFIVRGELAPSHDPVPGSRRQGAGRADHRHRGRHRVRHAARETGRPR